MIMLYLPWDAAALTTWPRMAVMTRAECKHNSAGARVH